MTDKYIALSGTDGNVFAPAMKTTDELVGSIGQNSGNLMFQRGATDIITPRCRIIGRDAPHHIGRLKKEARAVVIPSANFLREGADFSGFVDFLERVELPLVFLGLGAQADTFATSTFDFHPSVLRLISLIKERSKSVSVRGSFTAHVLEKFGVQNLQVTGCPSNFINRSSDLAERIASKSQMPISSFITHAEEPWPKSKLKAAADRRLLHWSLTGRSIVVQQSVPAVITYLRKANPFAKKTPPEHFEASLQRALFPELTTEAFRDFVSTRLRNYVSADQWMEDSAKFDFSIGMRLHGNMAAWQAGTPAMWIYHDARTQELVETMNLPRISIQDFLDHCQNIEDVRKRWEFDPVTYTETRIKLYKRMQQVLAAHDIGSDQLRQSPDK